MQALKVKGQTDQSPLTSRRRRSPQGKLTKAQDFFDDANDRFDCAFAETVDFTSRIGLEFVGHLDFGSGRVGRWVRLLSEQGLPGAMMRFTTRSDVWLNAALFTSLEGGRTKITVVQRRPFHLAQIRGERREGGEASRLSLG